MEAWLSTFGEPVGFTEPQCEWRAGDDGTGVLVVEGADLKALVPRSNVLIVLRAWDRVSLEALAAAVIEPAPAGA